LIESSSDLRISSTSSGGREWKVVIGESVVVSEELRREEKRVESGEEGTERKREAY